MPLFETAEKRKFHPMLEFQDLETISGNAFAGSHNSQNKVNSNFRKVAALFGEMV